MLSKLTVFLWKDWVEARSYRIALLLRYGGIFAPLLILFFLDRMFAEMKVASIERYGGDYVAFALVGIVIATYSGACLRAFSNSLSSSQRNGTLEMLFLTRAGLHTMLVGWSLYPMLRVTLNMLVFLTVGFAILGLRFGEANLVGALLVVALMIVIMSSLGIMAAGFTLVFKRGDVFTATVVLAATVLSGSVYPVAVLPEALQVVSKILPQTHAIEAMRLAVLRGYSMTELVPYLLVLVAIAVALLPLSLAAFRLAAHRSKVEGSLSHY